MTTRRNVVTMLGHLVIGHSLDIGVWSLVIDMKIHLIAAVTSRGVIGNIKGLPWHIPEDLRHFKKLTTGKTVLMGRTTFDTIGRPLPHRQNIVLDKDKKLITGAHVCGSLPEALALAKKLGNELYIMGGASVYAQMLPLTQIMHLSHIKKNYEGDIFFPEYDKKEWQEVAREEYEEFTAVTYKRKTKNAKLKTTMQNAKQLRR